MNFNLEKFRQGKSYDLLMGAPLIAWFVYVLINMRPELRANAIQVLAQPSSLYWNLRFFSYFASAAFAFFNIVMVVIRTTPVRRLRGLIPRGFAIAGAFLGVGINYLTPAQLPLFWQSLALMLILVGSVGSVIALSNLGKSFSVMPEARRLVTSGPYAVARHPLYAAEMFSIAGTAILYQQPWAGLLAVSVFALLAIRSHFEEQVLGETYPEYAAYRAKVKRFGFL